MSNDEEIVEELKNAEKNGLLNLTKKSTSGKKEFTPFEKQSHLKFSQQKLLDSIHTQVWFLTDDHTYGAVNEAHAQYNGCTKEELEFKDMYDIFPKETVDVCRKGNKEVFESKKPIISDEWVPHISGEKRLIRIFKNPVFDEKSNVEYVVCSAEDITEMKKAEQQIKDNERFFTDIFDGFQDGISVLDKNLNITHVNKWIKENHHDKLPLIGKKCYEAFQDRSSPCPWCPSLKTISTGSVYRERVNVTVSENDTAWIELSSYPYKNANDEIIGVIEHVKDVTQGTEMEEKLRSSEQNFRTFFETIDDIMIIGTPDGKILFTNSAVSKKLGYTADNLKEMTILDLHPKKYQQEAGKIFKEMFEGKRNFCPLPLQKKDGTYLPVETKVWFGKWDGMDCVFGISKDLSVQQAALEKFHKLFDNNPALMAVSTMPDRRFVEVNDAFLERLGYTRDEIVGKSSGDLHLFVESEKQRMVTHLLKKEGCIKNIELDVRRKDGTIITGLFSGEIIDNQGQKSFLTVMTDITDQKKAKKELHEKIDVLERYKQVTVDRELKMIELKKEIEKLKKREE